MDPIPDDRNRLPRAERFKDGEKADSAPAESVQ